MGFRTPTLHALLPMPSGPAYAAFAFSVIQESKKGVPAGEKSDGARITVDLCITVRFWLSINRLTIPLTHTCE